MVVYNCDILERLKNSGYSAYRLRKDKIMGEATIQRLRENKSVSFDVLSKICDLLDCQIGDILVYKKD